MLHSVEIYDIFISLQKFSVKIDFEIFSKLSSQDSILSMVMVFLQMISMNSETKHCKIPHCVVCTVWSFLYQWLYRFSRKKLHQKANWFYQRIWIFALFECVCNRHYNASKQKQTKKSIVWRFRQKFGDNRKLLSKLCIWTKTSAPYRKREQTTFWCHLFWVIVHLSFVRACILNRPFSA